VAQTENIGPDAVSKIGTALIEEYGNIKRIAFEKPPVDRVGAILNSSTALTRDDMLAGLDDADAQFAKQVRKAIFTFVDIPVRLRTSDIPNIVRVVDADVLSLALAAALAGEPPLVEAAEFILANISQRMAGQMREDAAEKGTIKTAVAEEAMNKVTTAIREQADSGAISLIDPDEQDADA
jgi:flagellar motor switch protein FliG